MRKCVIGRMIAQKSVQTIAFANNIVVIARERKQLKMVGNIRRKAHC